MNKTIFFSIKQIHIKHEIKCEQTGEDLPLNFDSLVRRVQNRLLRVMCQLTQQDLEWPRTQHSGQVLWDSSDEINWSGKSLHNCGQHNFIGWGPGLILKNDINEHIIGNVTNGISCESSKKVPQTMKTRNTALSRNPTPEHTGKGNDINMVTKTPALSFF